MIFTKRSFFFYKPRAYGKHIFPTSYFQIRGSCVLYAMALFEIIDSCDTKSQSQSQSESQSQSQSQAQAQAQSQS